MQVVLNSRTSSVWQTEIRTSVPSFTNGVIFQVDIHCLTDKFRIYKDGQVRNLISVVDMHG